MEDLMSSDIQNLVKLLNLEEQNSSEEDEENYPALSLNPSTIACYGDQFSKSAKETETKKEYSKYEKLEISKDIWSEDEVFDEISDELLSKKCPDYELVYQQNVTPDDIYLQLSCKGPGSNTCDSMILKIHLEEIISAEEIDLNVSANTLSCKTKKHFLDLALPRTVDPEKSSAKWNQGNYVLIVELILNENIS